MFSNEEKKLIEELNLQNLTEEQQTEQLQKYYGALQTKVGMAIEDKLSDEQLLEFEKLADAGDDEATTNWLKETVPDYEKIVADETAELNKFIKESSDKYLDIVKEVGKEDS